MYNLVEQLLQCPGMIRSGRIIVIDSAYVTTILLKDAALPWGLRFIGAATAKTAYIPENFSAVKSVTSRWIRGYSQTMHCYSLNITFWNDSNVSGPEQWNFIKTRAGESLLEINAPLVTRIYRQTSGIVDCSNQEGTYYKLDRKTRRKQNDCLLFDAIDTYGLINTHIMLINILEIVADLKKRKLSTREFRPSLVRSWFARCRMSTGLTTLHYPFVAKKHPPNMLSLFIHPGMVHINHAKAMQSIPRNS